MCYSGTCDFENHMGNCTVPCTSNYEDKLGVSSCVVGGYEGVPKECRISDEEKISLDLKAKELNLL